MIREANLPLNIVDLAPLWGLGDIELKNIEVFPLWGLGGCLTRDATPRSKNASGRRPPIVYSLFIVCYIYIDVHFMILNFHFMILNFHFMILNFHFMTISL